MNIDLIEVHEIIQSIKKLEKAKSYDRMIDSYRLPRQIRVQGFVYNLGCGDVDDSCELSYTNTQRWPKKKVYMHYEESTMQECILKAFRKFANNRDWVEVQS